MVKVFNTPRYMFSAYTLFDFDLPRPNKYRIEVDKTFFAPATNLFKSDLKIQSPGKRAKVDPKTAEIKWEPYPDAAYYEVDLVNLREKGASYAKQGRVEGNIFKIDKPLTDGYYQLKTVAYNSNRVKLSEGTVNFTVISRAEPTTKTQSNINK